MLGNKEYAMMSGNNVRWVVSMGIVSLVNTAYMATTNTWDADIGTTGAQDGSGTWTSSLSASNWWSNAAVNTNWDNSAFPDLTVIGAGSGAAGAITLGEPVTVGHLRFNAAGTGSYTLEGNGNPLTFGMNFPLLWVSSGVTVTNRISSDNNTRDLDITGGGTIIFEGTNIFHSVDVMDAQTAWFGITGGVAGTTITIPFGASFKTVGASPNWQYSIFGFRMRDYATLNVSGSLTLLSGNRLGGHSSEDYFTININPGAVVTNTGNTVLGWNATATLNMNGGVMTGLGGVDHQDGSAGYLNLNGGKLETTRVSSGGPDGGAYYISFNGGTLKALGNDLLIENTDKNTLSTYQVRDGGAVIDCNGYNPEAILAFTRKGSGGLTKQGSGTLTFSGGSYTGATTVAAGTLNLNFNRRNAWVARDAVSEFYDRTSRLVLNGGNLVVTGRAPAPSVTKTFTVGDQNAGQHGWYDRCARLGSTAGLVAGMPVSGLYIPAGTYITYIKDAARLALSQATVNAFTSIVSLTFGAVTNTTWQTINNVELQQNATITVNANGGPGTTLTVGAITGPGSLTKDGTGTLAFTGTNTYGGATVIKGGTVKLAASVTVTNASFETHSPLAEHPPYGFFGAPADAFWAYSNSAGIAVLGSTWVSSNAVIDGAYAAFVQASTSAGAISTTLSLPADGQYVISFMAGKRPNMAACDLLVEIDGVSKFGFAAAEFNEAGAMYTGAAYLSGGTHTLTFRGPYMAGVDTAIWIDRVVVDTSAGDSLAGNLPAGTAVTVASGAVLDLGGKTQALAGLGGSGLVTNGTLVVSGITAPGGTNAVGTLTLATATALTGTLLVDATLAGTNDLLKVQGTLNLPAGATLQIQDVAQLKRGTSYVIATCTPGGLTGQFTSTNLAVGSRWHVVYDTGKGEVRVEVARGSVIRLN